MSFNYSTYGAPLPDAYGTNQPPAPIGETKRRAHDAESHSVNHHPVGSESHDQKERTRKLDALKQRIHGGNASLIDNKVAFGSNKVALGSFEPPPNAQSGANTTIMSPDTLDEPLQDMPPPAPASAGDFPLDYASATDAYTKTGEQHALLEKLNYAIHLLETQQDRRTATVTEELLLYALLGMFIICVLDNFARVGKYVR